jgi:hypothetical protein
MNITRSTKWNSILPFLTAERIAQLKESISDCAIFDFWQFDLGDFSQMISGHVPDKLWQKMQDDDMSVEQAVSLMNAIEPFLKEFEAVMKQYYIQPTAEEEFAMRGTPETTVIEAMHEFILSHFGQHPTKGGYNENITLIEYAMAKKATFVSRLQNKNIEEYRKINAPKI